MRRHAISLVSLQCAYLFSCVPHSSLRYALGQGGEGMGCVGIHDAVSVVFDMREAVVKGESIPNLHIWVINGIGTDLKYDDAPNVTLYVFVMLTELIVLFACSD